MIYSKEEMTDLMDKIEKDYRENGIILKREDIEWYTGDSSIAGNCMELFEYRFEIEGFGNLECPDEDKKGVDLVIKFWKEDCKYTIEEYGGQISQEVDFGFQIRTILNDFISGYNDIEAEICDAEDYGGIYLSARKNVSGAREFCEILEKYKKFIANFKDYFNVK
jgi:hypothetical protein